MISTESDTKKQHKPKVAWYRIKTLFKKEFYLIARDPIIFVSAILFPLLEVIIFATLFNINPRHLQTTVLMGEYTPITRSIVQAFSNSNYFDITNQTANKDEANASLKSGKSQFILEIPAGFTRDVIRGKEPKMMLVADGSIPIVIAGAIGAVDNIVKQALNYDLKGVLKEQQAPPAFNVVIQQRYNPSVIARYYTVPCLVSIVLFLTMMMLSSMSIAKEKTEGTMESLLTTPALPVEVIISKMVPYFIFGFIQFIVVLIITHIIFSVPFYGSIWLILFSSFFLIGACLSVGLIFSSKSNSATTALQASSQFFALNVLFSGFLFPFYGMPGWAQFIGNLLPVTHYIRINLAITLKGSSFIEIWPDLWPIILFMIIAMIIGVKSYHQTLD